MIYPYQIWVVMWSIVYIKISNIGSLKTLLLGDLTHSKWNETMTSKKQTAEEVC